MSDTGKSKKTSRQIGERLLRPFEEFLLLDLLKEPQTRGILAYSVVIVLLGALIYHWLEGWSLLDATYFVVITLTTIGYGDLTPTTSITKVVTIFFALNGVSILLILLDQIRRLRERRPSEELSQE